MPNYQTPPLDPVRIDQLRPTQITVGMREVRAKQKQWRDRKASERAGFFGKHMIPAVLGPKKRHYILDHHHLARALHEEGVEQVLVSVGRDLSRLDKTAFWTFLDNCGWTHPFDAEGRRRDFGELPKSIADLADDPYRSLAGELRRAGGFAKDTTPFSEFLWADYLRRQVVAKLIDEDFPSALKQAMKLAKSHDADYLPGWCGPYEQD